MGSQRRGEKISGEKKSIKGGCMRVKYNVTGKDGTGEGTLHCQGDQTGAGKQGITIKQGLREENVRKRPETRKPG